MQPLSSEESQSRLASLSGWKIEAGELVKTFQFKDFRAALHFVNGVGEQAEQAGHHPDIDIRYNRVRLALTTHDAGGLTQKDFDLAGQTQKLAD
ncbi:MAG: 4a-hydroxytetrahydrobiopterin dehydratase [Terracidiphilus sp.]|jgi:4a-hydroxytetrahydrobiopterin dehydratase